ncbi:NAD-dependent epimerase/dehydratase family protein [Paraglaciecola sp.]|uniref:NAD-dependent epimerase/dehydratase family protein n=1 Tax=Paraglaciecola sp. TaxID=1920173 RepID=UPI003EF80EBA
MKILVTGNLGYVGPAVLSQLKKIYPDCQICGLDTGYFEKCKTIQSAYLEKGIDQQIKIDIREIEPDHFNDIDIVVHLAAISNDPMGEKYEQVTREINFLASKKCAQMAKACGVNRFVFASSCSVYGASDTNKYADEESALNPVTTYAKSKVDFEHYLNSICDDKFTAISLRYATACGASSRLRLDLVLNDFVFTAMKERKINILSDGSPWRPLIDTQDMGKAIAWACTHKMQNGEFNISLNVGDEKNNFQIKELAYLVQEQLGNVEVSINQQASIDNRSYRVDFSKFRRLAPSFQPSISITQSIQQVATSTEELLKKAPSTHINEYKRLNILSAMTNSNQLDEQLKWQE